MRRSPRSSAAYDGALSTGENLFSTQDVENLVRFGGLKASRGDIIQVDPPQCLWHRAICPHARHARPPQLAAHAACSRTAATRCRCTSPAASGWAAPSPTPACSAVRAASPTMPEGGERLPEAARPAGHRFRGPGGALSADYERAGRIDAQRTSLLRSLWGNAR